MKSKITDILWAVATTGSMLLIFFAGYMAVNKTGREQSGWDMALFFSAAIMLALFDINSVKGSWLPKVLAVMCIFLAIIFGFYYFVGEEGLKMLVGT